MTCPQIDTLIDLNCKVYVKNKNIFVMQFHRLCYKYNTIRIESWLLAKVADLVILKAVFYPT